MMYERHRYRHREHWPQSTWPNRSWRPILINQRPFYYRTVRSGSPMESWTKPWSWTIVQIILHHQPFYTISHSIPSRKHFFGYPTMDRSSDDFRLKLWSGVGELGSWSQSWDTNQGPDSLARMMDMMVQEAWSCRIHWNGLFCRAVRHKHPSGTCHAEL